MATMQVKGLDEYAEKLASLYKDSERLTKEAVYAGASVVADSIKSGLKSLPVDNNSHASKDNMLKGITRRQKADLIDAFGLAPIENDGEYINTKAGFDGYGQTKSKKYPNGLPNALLMRSVESGTSFRKKTPVIRKAVNSSRKAAVQAMDKKMEEICTDIMK